MDWFSWLSKTCLDPSIVYNYAITFTRNELQEDDIAYFNHEILQSMGICIAKHRLEILKLAKKKKQHKSIRPMLWLVLAMQQTKNYVSKHVQTWVCREDSALAIVPKRNHSSRWKVATLKSNKRWNIAAKQERPMLINGGPAQILMLTNGSPLEESMSWNNNSFSSPMVQEFVNNEKMDGFDEGEFWSSGVEDMRWDALFQGLKPT